MLLNNFPNIGGKAVKEGKGQLWSFLPGNSGAFISPYADYISRLYFPLLNVYGMKCSITPELKGDIASSFEHYLTAATVTEELHRNVSGRNGWLLVEGEEPWSMSGNSAGQKARKWTDSGEESEVEGRIGAFISRRSSEKLKIESEVTIFVPAEDDYIELTKIKITNKSSKARKISFTGATAIFGRHADNFRDHRQVTTMFQKVRTTTHGVYVSPNIVHDEHGHSENKVIYSVLGFNSEGDAPHNIWSVMADFIGEGGSLDNPEAVFRDLTAKSYVQGEADGKEAVGALGFKPEILAAGESMEYIIMHGITERAGDMLDWGKKYGSSDKFDFYLEKTLKWWAKTAGAIEFKSAEGTFDNWIKWVTFQLLCRQIFGNSFLPDFGYGRGGRGWRDLWQDLLSIFLVDPISAREEMLNNFKGVRVDGSNATIIGSKPGEFIADRNNVPRTWCDHGAWPVFVLNFYIQQTGDLEVLEMPISYWKDKFAFRCKKIDEEWERNSGFQQRDKQGTVYEGSILEHILLQQLTAFFNVGENNNLKLEGGDWNDTLDMARERGESVCFHSFYGFNLNTIAQLLQLLLERGMKEFFLLEEMSLLLDRVSGDKVDYSCAKSKNERLNIYLNRVRHTVSGKKIGISIVDLIDDLRQKSAHIRERVRTREWIKVKEGIGFFNGHYDNLGQSIHGIHDGKVRIDLTSQVIPVMCDIPDKEQVSELCEAIKMYLKDGKTPGLRLCSKFEELDLNIGRITGFTYGQKEHGSKWSQQMIMFIYGLYKQGYVEEGFQILKEVYHLSTNSAQSLIFPGLPSFFGPEDRGAYNYLTGSSTWLILALTTEIFGVDAFNGDLLIKPKLNDWFFDAEGYCSIKRNFRDVELTVTYKKLISIAYPEFRIKYVKFDKSEITIGEGQREILIPYEIVEQNSVDGSCTIEVFFD